MFTIMTRYRSPVPHSLPLAIIHWWILPAPAAYLRFSGKNHNTEQRMHLSMSHCLLYGCSVLRPEHKKQIERICWKVQESHTDEESIIVMVVTASAFLDGDFEVFFQSGFAPEGVAESFLAIGHKMAAYTVRMAYRVYRFNPSDPALKILANAIDLMKPLIETLLADYLEKVSMSDSQH
jgi:hypothetical protein